MTYDAELVWACAVAVDRINDGYLKEDEYEWDTEGEYRIAKYRNKAVVKRWLALESYDLVTDADREQGKAIRHYFNGYLLKELSGKINDFEQNALKIAQMDEFTNRNMFEFAVISCLPSTKRREEKNKILRDEIMESTPIEGEVGDYVIGDLIVIKSYYNDNYNRYRITGRFGESFVDFWFKEHLAVDSTVKIKGKIKQHRIDNTTQLNYVKKIN